MAGDEATRLLSEGLDYNRVCMSERSDTYSCSAVEILAPVNVPDTRACTSH
ncbi:uncharacterized protein METZ01_LOCUS31097 [marine metagenome]|uniref:Uncharacterized protein n=1 Tax=marine metagenome TaxID=408172 RepID=A0A381QKX9_9ZZZZ